MARPLQTTLRLCAAALFVVLAPVAALAGSTTVSDTEFADGDWFADAEILTNGASDTAVQSLVDGNPGAYRFMTHTMPAAVGPGLLEKTQLWVFHKYLPETYDPATQGAITTFDYQEDQIQ